MSNAMDEENEKHLSDWDPSINRRDFLTYSIASLAAAGFTGCIRPPVEKIFAYVSRPEEETLPGEFQYFATAQVIGGLASGLLVSSHQGKPTKIEGNPSHPSNLGAASAFQQAHVLSLYDPDRAQEATKAGNTASWKLFKNEVRALSQKLKATQGKGLVFLTERSTSLSVASEMNQLQKKYPLAQWIQYDPLIRGETFISLPDLAKAKTIVSFDSDLFTDPLYPVSATRALLQNNQRKLMVAESSPTLLGTRADTRIALKPSELDHVIHDIYERLVPHGQKQNLSSALPLSESAQQFATIIVNEVSKSDSAAFLIDRAASPHLQAMVASLNQKWNSTIESPHSPSETDLEALTRDLNSGNVEAIFVVGGNPVYASAQKLQFGEALKKAKWSARLGLYQDETAQSCQWFLPLAHELESWGDALAANGSVTLVQPLIAPLYDGKSIHEVLDLFADQTSDRSVLEIVQTEWKKRWGAQFTSQWHEALRLGVVSGVTLGHTQKKLPSLAPENQNHSTPLPAQNEFEIHFTADQHTYDGRFTNNAWLQEFPAPLTHIAWENVALLHPEDAKSLQVKNGDFIRLKTADGAIEAPAWIQPGQARGCISVSFGYGRTHAGKVGNHIGYNAFQIWDGNRAVTATVEKTSKTTTIASTQEHHSMEGRDLIRVMKPEETQKKPKPYFASLFPGDPTPDEHAWSMVIDLDACTGCGACVIACQSENNIPVVGKEMVLMGREMHWIRVDRYFANAGENPIVHFQPVTCMHCEKAPCETVCPTGATVHGNGGLNQMVYNRCVGTRYCSNNCPYKVRRFNFFNYSKTTAVGKLQKNPNVSIRSRGMMEKCSYCVQRINTGRVQAEIENRKVKDLEIKTACQSTCPAQAIHFGDLHDEQSIARRLRESARNYSLLEELGTKPRTTYLAKIERAKS